MSMKTMLAGASMLVVASTSAWAGVSAQEAAKLGGELTAFGAIKAGNADGSIPAYTGGLTRAPAGYVPGSYDWVDPFANEKPILKIDASNVEKYKDKLSAGAVKIIKDNPQYHMNVYPTHRTVAYPDDFLKATVRNATTCNTTKEGLAIEEACKGGLPFPIPKTGYEVMWNKAVAFTKPKVQTAYAYVMDRTGSKFMTSTVNTYTEASFYTDPSLRSDSGAYQILFSKTTAPARKSGEATGFTDYIDPMENGRRAWSYTIGQRRVRLAPEFSYDTPVSTLGGVMLYDELFVFNGAMDRFDFKLVGKKEMYVPYSNYKMFFHCEPDKLLQPGNFNPECERWELHRMWVVEATLKPGYRHAYAKRHFYLDEDTYHAAMSDEYDHSGNLYRSGFSHFAQFYDSEGGGPGAPGYEIFDFVKGTYAITGLSTGFDKSFYFVPPIPENKLAPEAIAGSNIR